MFAKRPTGEEPRRRYGSGGLRRKKGSPYWYGEYYENGRRRSASLKTTSRMVADRKLLAIQGRVAQGGQPTDVRKVTYKDLREALQQDYEINERKSLHRGKGGPVITQTKWLDKFFMGYRATAITTDAIQKFVLSRQAADAANGTINRSLSALKRMFTLAVRAGKLQAAPYIPMLKEAPARKGFLEVPDYELLRDCLPEHLRPVLVLAYNTGLRLGEIQNLRWGSVKTEQGVIVLNPGETKSDEARLVPLAPEAKLELDRLAIAATSPESGAPDPESYVFGNGRPLGSFRKQWESCCVKAGLGKFEYMEGKRLYTGPIFHDLRRSAVRNLTKAGVPQTVAMQISGHRTASVFRRYNIVDDGDLREAARKLGEFMTAEKNRPGPGAEIGAKSAPFSDDH